MNSPNGLFFDYDIFDRKLDSIDQDNQVVINTINQYSFCIAEKDPEFKEALTQSDILLPDGIGVVWANYLLNGRKLKKIAGADLHEFYLKKLNKGHGKCFYLGSSDATLSKIQERLIIEYPNIKFAGFSPPFKDEFSVEDSHEMIEKVNQFSPDVLFVGMTAPKQEKWVIKNRHLLNPKKICSIGAVFDFYAGTIQRPNKLFIELGLEWFGRFLSEPKRMRKRYFYYGPVFLYKTIMEKIRLSFIN